MKREVQNEILALLDDEIDNEINAMQNHFTVAEIANEVLLRVADRPTVKPAIDLVEAQHKAIFNAVRNDPDFK